MTYNGPPGGCVTAPVDTTTSGAGAIVLIPARRAKYGPELPAGYPFPDGWTMRRIIVDDRPCDTGHESCSGGPQ